MCARADGGSGHPSFSFLENSPREIGICIVHTLNATYGVYAKEEKGDGVCVEGGEKYLIVRCDWVVGKLFG